MSCREKALRNFTNDSNVCFNSVSALMRTSETRESLENICSFFNKSFNYVLILFDREKSFLGLMSTGHFKFIKFLLSLCKHLSESL